MRAAVLDSPYNIAVLELPEPTVDEDEVLLAVSTCGICGSDLHEYRSGPHLYLPSRVGGHEIFGYVTAVGTHVLEPCIGDYVTVTLSRPCNKCSYCTSNRGHLCERNTASTIPKGGGFADSCVVKAGQAVRVPPSLQSSLASLVEPLAVAIHASNMLHLPARQPILIVGSGPLALLIARWLAYRGCSDISLACKYNAIKTKALSYCRTIDIRNEKAAETLRHRRFRFAFDCAGTASSFNTCVTSLARGGRLIEVALHSASHPLNVSSLMFSEIEIKGSFLYTATEFNEAVTAAAERAVDLGDIVDEIVPLERISYAFDRLISDRNTCLKMAIAITEGKKLT